MPLSSGTSPDVPLEEMLRMASRCSTLDELRGCEGAASARYFELWTSFLPAAFPFERRMERQFLSEQATHRTTLRQQLENQAVLFKASLEVPERFEPFLMN